MNDVPCSSPWEQRTETDCHRSNKFPWEELTGAVWVHIANIMEVVTAPYGSWESDISSDVVIKKSVSFKEVKVDPFQEGKKMEALIINSRTCVLWGLK